jgi:hypothetical protein
MLHFYYPIYMLEVAYIIGYIFLFMSYLKFYGWKLFAYPNPNSCHSCKYVTFLCQVVLGAGH